ILVLRQEVRLAQQPRVPIRRPAFVHDLAREHRIEVERLLAHRAEDVALPLLELGRVLRDHPEQIALGLRWNRRARALERGIGYLRSAREVLEALLERVARGAPRWLDVLGVTTAAQRLERVDVSLERQGGVEHLLDACLTVLLDRLAYLA